ncbi:MAG TPA: bifunctional diguanylate cyclase/phosphodiesterase, partial [Rhodanobacter sp.]
MNHVDAVDVPPSYGSLQLTWLTRLTAANTPDEVGAVIADLAQARPGCRAACVLWGLSDPAHHRSAPSSVLDVADCPWLHEAARSDAACWHADRQRVAIRLCRQPEPALLMLTLQPGYDGAGFLAALAAPLQLAGQHLRRALEWSELQHSHQQLERSEALQRALFAISDLAGSDRDMPDMLRGIHAIVSTLMYAENFFIVLRNIEQDTIRFLYFVDIEDPTSP